MSEEVICNQRHWNEVEGGAMGIARMVPLIVPPIVPLNCICWFEWIYYAKSFISDSFLGMNIKFWLVVSSFH